MCVGAYLYLSSENVAMRLKKHLALVTNQKENYKKCNSLSFIVYYSAVHS